MSFILQSIRSLLPSTPSVTIKLAVYPLNAMPAGFQDRGNTSVFNLLQSCLLLLLLHTQIQKKTMVLVVKGGSTLLRVPALLLCPFSMSCSLRACPIVSASKSNRASTVIHWEPCSLSILWCGRNHHVTAPGLLLIFHLETCICFLHQSKDYHK